MANPNPSVATRWKPGQSGNAGRTGPRRRTILARVPVVRSLEEVKAKEDAWCGSMRELIVSAQLSAHSKMGRGGTGMVSTINEVDTIDERSLKLLEA
jgi:hypothetical protein